MNNNKKTIKDAIECISDVIAVEGEMAGAELLTTLMEKDFSASTTARAVRLMKEQGALRFEGEGLSLTKNNIIFVKEYVEPATPTVQPIEQPAPTTESKSKKVDPTRGHFGTTKQMSEDGEVFNYNRRDVDGQEIAMTKDFFEIKKDLISIKTHITKELKNVFIDGHISTIGDFTGEVLISGVGGTAIRCDTLSPETPFFRWDSQRGKDLALLLHKTLFPATEEKEPETD